MTKDELADALQEAIEAADRVVIISPSFAQDVLAALRAPDEPAAGPIEAMERALEEASAKPRCPLCGSL